MVAIQSLCDSAICLHSGRLVDRGAPEPVVAAYLSDGSRIDSSLVWTNPSAAPGSDSYRLHRVEIISRGIRCGRVSREDDFEIAVSYWSLAPNILLNVSLTVYTAEQLCVFNAISRPSPRAKGLITETCIVPGSLLNEGIYYVHVMVVRDAAHPAVNVPDAVAFEVFEIQRGLPWYGHWVGVIRPSLTWKVVEERFEAQTDADACAAV
jgi:lipopolysaccharide transport system ATP-binding protein